VSAAALDDDLTWAESDMWRGEDWDVVGIGFGPSHLALAIAVDEWNGSGAGPPVRARFFERQPRFGWHRGMLLEGATMQVSFVKDLVTMRDPTSRFSFLNYLHEVGRLPDFVNHKILFPLRVEFHDYFEWAAAALDDAVSYGSEVVDVRPITAGGTVEAYDVVVRQLTPGGDLTVHRTRHVAVAVGLEMSLPPNARLSERIWHNLDLLSRVDRLAQRRSPGRLVVVGAGQSAAEATEFLHRRFPESEVCSVFARYGYSPADDTPFANRIFDAEAVDTYFGAPRAVKRMLFDYHRNTNYSVVDQDLIEELYRRSYQEKVEGRQRLRIFNATVLVEVIESDDVVEVVVEHLPTGRRTVLAADALVYATGYRPVDVCRVLGDAGAICQRDEEGELRLTRDWRAVTSPPSAGGIFVQGGTEHAHGITATLLSNLAVRAGEVLASVVATPAAANPPAPARRSSADLGSGRPGGA
jgi:L-ornithine N5-oxygenase